MSEPKQLPTDPAVPLSPIVGREVMLVIQGLAVTAWRDIETQKESAYAVAVMPQRLLEHSRGDCWATCGRYSKYRMIRREIVDREYTPNITGQRSAAQEETE